MTAWQLALEGSVADAVASVDEGRGWTCSNLCIAMLAGHGTWSVRAAAVRDQQLSKGQINLAAAMSILLRDPLHAVQCYRDAGCAREALALAGSHLLPADPATLQLRSLFASQALPSPQSAAADGAAGGGAAAGRCLPELAAANLLLLQQPLAAARALAVRAGGSSSSSSSSSSALHAAARVAALAAPHQAGKEQQQLCELAATYSLQAVLAPASGSGNGGHAEQLQLLRGLLPLLQQLASSCAAPPAGAALLLLHLAHQLLGAAGRAAEARCHQHQQQLADTAAALEGAAAGKTGALDPLLPSLLPSRQQAMAAVRNLLQLHSACCHPEAQVLQQVQHLWLQLPEACLGSLAAAAAAGDPPAATAALAASLQQQQQQPGINAVSCCVVAAYSLCSSLLNQQHGAATWEQHVLPLLLQAVQQLRQTPPAGEAADAALPPAGRCTTRHYTRQQLMQLRCSALVTEQQWQVQESVARARAPAAAGMSASSMAAHGEAAGDGQDYGEAPVRRGGGSSGSSRGRGRRGGSTGGAGSGRRSGQQLQAAPLPPPPPPPPQTVAQQSQQQPEHAAPLLLQQLQEQLEG